MCNNSNKPHLYIKNFNIQEVDGTIGQEKVEKHNPKMRKCFIEMKLISTQRPKL